MHLDFEKVTNTSIVSFLSFFRKMKHISSSKRYKAVAFYPVDLSEKIIQEQWSSTQKVMVKNVKFIFISFDVLKVY